MDEHLHLWLNVATLLVVCGGAFYASLWRYME